MVNFELLSSEPMSDRPHPREVARAAIAAHRAMGTTLGYESLRNAYQPSKPRALTQSDIDGTGSRGTLEYTRRAVKGHHASLLRKILNLLG